MKNSEEPLSAAPATARATVCLSMIVKNEAAVIRRCLASVRDFIDTWAICDTGSTDATKQIIQETLADIPGELHECEWVNFGHNRTEAYRLAQPQADYVLIIDADMTALVQDEFRHNLSADSYLIRYEGDLDYRQPMLLNAQHDWAFRGVTHEYIHAETAASRETLAQLTYQHHADGGMRSDKLTRDKKLLTAGLAAEPDNARSMFYLAQTLRDLREYTEAIEWYRRRVAAGGWAEEVWYSRYQIARLRQLTGASWDTVQAEYLQAFESRPTRLEPLYEIVRYYRERQKYHIAWLFARNARNTPYPDDLLFVERPVYTYKLPLEYAICCHWTGRYAEAMEVNNELLARADLPPEYQLTVIRNQKFSLDALFPSRAPAPATRNKIKVIVPFHNPGHFLDNCVASLLAQDYDNFEVIAVDDASTDNSHEKVPTEDPRFTLVRNAARMGGAYNLHTAITTHCRNPDDIVVIVDGDDWLEGKDVFSYLNRFYNEQDCWIAYGQFRYSTGQYGAGRPYPNRASFARLRHYWYASPLRSFRAGLYHQIKQQDPDYACMKDSHGEWFTTAWDMALMYPLLDLAGFDRVRYNDRILYVYNVENPLNVHKVEPQKEIDDGIEIRRKKPLQTIADYRMAAQ